MFVRKTGLGSENPAAGLPTSVCGPERHSSRGSKHGSAGLERAPDSSSSKLSPSCPSGPAAGGSRKGQTTDVWRWTPGGPWKGRRDISGSWTIFLMGLTVDASRGLMNTLGKNIGSLRGIPEHSEAMLYLHGS
uniref:Uncharacterized protein n=1 Tax=Molossus molossus TaxID=27622 RepID=A0A7J8DBW8_MOLMO|nr:hypothetical protein HJG59_009361 [Molossus molossus]